MLKLIESLCAFLDNLSCLRFHIFSKSEIEEITDMLYLLVKKKVRFLVLRFVHLTRFYHCPYVQIMYRGCGERCWGAS